MRSKNERTKTARLAGETSALRRWLRWGADKLSLWLIMYAVTLTLFLYETGSLRKAAAFGAVAASVKALAATGHRHVSRSLFGDLDLE